MFKDYTKKVKDNISIQQKINTEYRKTLINNGLLKPHNGQSIFEYNVLTNTISYAQIESPKVINFMTWKADLGKKYLIEKKGCLYVCALNIKNAIKHFNRNFQLNIDERNVNISSNISNGGTALKITKKLITSN